MNKLYLMVAILAVIFTASYGECGWRRGGGGRSVCVRNVQQTQCRPQSYRCARSSQPVWCVRSYRPEWRYCGNQRYYGGSIYYGGGCSPQVVVPAAPCVGGLLPGGQYADYYSPGLQFAYRGRHVGVGVSVALP